MKKLASKRQSAGKVQQLAAQLTAESGGGQIGALGDTQITTAISPPVAKSDQVSAIMPQLVAQLPTVSGLVAGKGRSVEGQEFPAGEGD
jgi:hypothetical protein